MVGMHKRKVRSFVCREGRLTAGQQQAYQALWPRYGLTYCPGLAAEYWSGVFGRSAPLVVDIGFGSGESTLALAQAHPEWNIVGIEVYRTGIASLFRQLLARDIVNVRVMGHDAVEVLQHMVPAASLQRVQIFFPDPWPKKRHHKRRLIQPAFVALVADRLQAGGELALATDWPEYAEHMANTLEAQTVLRRLSGERYGARDALRPLTKFERRAQACGQAVWELTYAKMANAILFQ